MLLARPSQAPAQTLAVDAEPSVITEHVTWLDLIEPTDQESALVSRVTGLRVPSRSDLEEIESSSRSYRENDSLYLSAPLARRVEGYAVATPLGIVVSDRWILTIRFAAIPAFDGFGATVEKSTHPISSHGLLIGLLESIVDRSADVLEFAATELAALSAEVFRKQERPSRQVDRRLREVLHGIGRNGDVISTIRDSLLGLSRMVLYLGETIRTAEDSKLRGRLKTIERDIRSLSDFDAQITNKVQFLLDATLGFINIEQNNGLRILTVASIIGIAPTLIASIYGMNFKEIPELNWSFGYFYALTLMAVTIIAPLAWFRRIGWI